VEVEEKEKKKGTKERREVGRRAPKSSRGVSLDISTLLARWSFSRAG